MISFVVLHFIAGAVAGLAFAVRTLLALVAIVLIECLAAALALGPAAGLSALWALPGVQVGYLAGVLARALLEQTRAAARRVDKARLP